MWGWTSREDWRDLRAGWMGGSLTAHLEANAERALDALGRPAGPRASDDPRVDRVTEWSI